MRTAWAMGKTIMVVAVLLKSVETAQLAMANPEMIWYGLLPSKSRR